MTAPMRDAPDVMASLDGEMARRIRAHDWSRTPLGPIADWPQSLKTAAGLVVNAPMPMALLWGADGVMIYNDGYAAIAGGRHPRLLGSKVREGWPEATEFNDNVMKVGLAGDTLAYRDQEMTLRRHGRSEQVWFDLDYWPVPDESGVPAGVIATVVETTKRILADRQRDAASERLDMALSAGGGVGTWDWDVPADRVTADARFARLYGVDPDKARDGAPIVEFFGAMHPDDAARVQAEIAQALATGDPFNSEYRLLQSDGDVSWVSAQGRASLSAEGQPLRFPGVTFDITDRRRMIEALAEGEARYRTLFESIDEGFCVIDLLFDAADRPVDYRFVEINPAFERQTGLTAAVGRTMLDFAPDMEQHWFDMYGRVAITGEPARFENRAEALSRWYDVYAFRVGEPEQRRVAVLFSDVTTRKLVEIRQAVLLELSDALRDLTDPAEIAQASSRLLAEALNVSRVGYGVMDTQSDTITIDRDHNAPGVESLAGVVRLRDFGTYIDDLKRGEAVVIADAVRDDRTRDTAAALAGIKATALVNIPLVEQGEVVALVFANNAIPRVWRDEDVALIREVAELVRVAVERARASAALRSSESRYRALFEAIDEGFCIIEFIDGPEGPLSDYVHVEANAAYADNAGIPDVVGQKVRQMVGTEAQEWIDLYKGVLETGKPIRFEKELEQTGRWLELAAFRVEPAERHQVAVLFKDLTDRRKAEQALRESEQRLRLAMEAGGQGAWELDLVTMQLAASDHCKINFGREPGAPFTYEDLQNAVHPEDRERMQAAVIEAVQSGRTYDIEYRIIPEGRGEGWVQIKGQPFYAHDGTPLRMIGVSTDISARKTAEQTLEHMNDVLETRIEERTHELQAAHEALRQSQKMEAVGQLTGGIAHDFNNLLAGISGALELLSKRLAEGRLNGMDRYIDAAQGSAQRAASLTQRLLAFSRRQTLDPKPTDVNRLIGGMEDLIRRSVGPDVEVEVVGAGGLWTTRVDPSQLENALLNLCINARDAMAPDGGRLTIETANKWLDDKPARERDLIPGQYISLCVTDTGSGMTPQVQAQAFDPFFTTKPLGQGTGLGLSMIHGFVRQSGGQVRIYSEVGKGTTMCLYLPRYGGALEAGEAAEDTIVAEGGHGETVLVIDDEATVRMLVAEVLGEAGYHVIEAPDGPSGLDILRSDQRIDLLISDVGLPGGMNGRQVADAAREGRPDLKVLFITGYAENAAVGNGLLAPGMEVITKPFVMAELALKVHEMIEG